MNESPAEHRTAASRIRVIHSEADQRFSAYCDRALTGTQGYGRNCASWEAVEGCAKACRRPGTLVPVREDDDVGHLKLVEVARRAIRHYEFAVNARLGLRQAGVIARFITPR
jgi:hypothetical protein